MRYLPGNAQHIGARHSQQDSFGFADPEDRAFISHGGFLALVCDGMGGMEYGDAASRTAVRVFLDAYQRKTSAESIPDALERSVREANSQVVALAHSLGMAEGIGTTLVAVALHERSLYYISVGDSGLFFCSGGQCRMINRPHIFANILDAAVARGSMSRDDAENHPERESLTSYIGTESLEEIDHNLEPVPMNPGDTVLLASDGMFKTLDPDEINASLDGHPQSWPESLVTRTLAKKREYQDNVTVLSVTLETEDQAALPRTTVLIKPAAPAAPAPVPAPTPVVPIALPVAVPPPAPAPSVPLAVPPPAWTPPVSAPESAPAKGSKGAWWPLIVVLLVVAAGIAGYLYAKHYKFADLLPHSSKEPRMGRPAPLPGPVLGEKPVPAAKEPAPPAASPAPSTTPAPSPTPSPTPIATEPATQPTLPAPALTPADKTKEPPKPTPKQTPGPSKQ